MRTELLLHWNDTVEGISVRILRDLQDVRYNGMAHLRVTSWFQRATALTALKGKPLIIVLCIRLRRVLLDLEKRITTVSRTSIQLEAITVLVKYKCVHMQ